MNRSVEGAIQKILGDEKFISYEIVPQKAFSLDSILQEIKQSALCARFDAFVCTDSPLARLRHSSILASIKIKNALSRPVICTISVRDKNSIALQGEILGLNEFDIRIFLALRGDPLQLGDQPQAKVVFESGSSLVFDIIDSLNHGKDLQYHALKDSGCRIYGLGVINSFANDMDKLYKRMLRKISRGALALITQPIYDINNAKQLLSMIDSANRELGTNASLIFGYYPVTSIKTAEFLYHKLPGCYIPDSWICELRNASANVDKCKAVGLELSRNIYKELMSLYPKIHVMCANNIHIAESIL